MNSLEFPQESAVSCAVCRCTSCSASVKIRTSCGLRPGPRRGQMTVEDRNVFSFLTEITVDGVALWIVLLICAGVFLGS